jgi:hypothetical protein
MFYVYFFTSHNLLHNIHNWNVLRKSELYVKHYYVTCYLFIYLVRLFKNQYSNP